MPDASQLLRLGAPQEVGGFQNIPASWVAYPEVGELWAFQLEFRLTLAFLQATGDVKCYTYFLDRALVLADEMVKQAMVEGETRVPAEILHDFASKLHEKLHPEKD
jgi:hypothetical protein